MKAFLFVSQIIPNVVLIFVKVNKQIVFNLGFVRTYNNHQNLPAGL